jgi:DNA-binding NtrC family response regulator
VLANQRIDLILSEHHLADGSWRELLAEVREHGPDVPFLVMSRYDAGDAEPVLGHGAAEYLTKPLRVEALRIAVTKALEIDRMRRVNDDFQRFRRGERIAFAPAGRGGVPVAPAEGWSLDLATLERQAILRALEQTGGHRTHAARLLGISDRTLRNKLRAR